MKNMRAMRLTVVVLLLIAASAAGQRHRDSKYGFELKTIKGWEQVPPEPTDKYTVAKWAAPRDIRNFPARMLVHVFNKEVVKKKDGETTTGYGGNDFFGEKKSFISWAKRYRRGIELDPAKAKKLRIKAPKGVEWHARYWEVTRDSGYRLGGKPLGNFYSIIASITTEKREWAVELFVGEISKKKFKAQFLRVIKSFRILDADIEDPSANAAKTSKLSPREEARRRAIDNVTRTKGWWHVESENFILVTNMAKKKKALLNDLKKKLEILRKVYEKDFPPDKPVTAVSIVRICKDRQTYLNYGGSGGTAGYWNRVAKELVLFLDDQKKETRATLYHEGFHQYIYYSSGEVAPHSWFNEGHGDYYGGANVKGGKVIGIEEDRHRAQLIREALRQDDHVPIRDILYYTQGQYYGPRRSLCYAQGWSIVYFLKKGLRKDHPWHSIIPTYFKTLKEEYDKATSDEEDVFSRFRTEEFRKKACDAAFKGIDLDEFEKKWKAFILKGQKAK